MTPNVGKEGTNDLTPNPSPSQGGGIAPAPSPFARYKWTVVAMLWFICFFNYADRVAISSVFPILKDKYGFSKTELGIIGSAFTWIYAVGAPYAGHVGDRYSRKMVILAGLYIWSIITGFTALCTKVWHFVVVRGAEGLGETFYIPASMALISDYHTPATRSRAIGFHQTSIYAGTIGGGALAGWMAERYGWQSPFLLLGGAGMVLGLVLSAFIREPRRNEAEQMERDSQRQADMAAGNTMPDSGWEAVYPHSEREHIPFHVFLAEMTRNPTFVLLISAFWGANLIAWVFLTWMPLFLKEKFGLSLALAGVGATVFIQLASMVGAPLGGWLGDRWARRQTHGRIRAQALGALLGSPFVVLCGYTRSIPMLIVAMSLFGLCKGIHDANLTPAFYDVVPPPRRASATGLMNLIGWLGAGLGPLVMGIALDHGVSMSAAIASTGAIYLLTAILLYRAAAVFRARHR